MAVRDCLSCLISELHADVSELVRAKLRKEKKVLELSSKGFTFFPIPEVLELIVFFPQRLIKRYSKHYGETAFAF